MPVFLMGSGNNKYHIIDNNSETIDSLKGKIVSKYGIPKEQLELYDAFTGCDIGDDENIKDHRNICIHLRLRAK